MNILYKLFNVKDTHDSLLLDLSCASFFKVLYCQLKERLVGVGVCALVRVGTYCSILTRKENIGFSLFWGVASGWWLAC